MPRSPLKTASPVGEQAWVEDAEGTRTRIALDAYEAWSAGHLEIAGAVQGARGLRFSTPSGYLEDDTVVEVAGVTYACLRAQRHMGEADDIVVVPATWRAGRYEVRPGIRLINGEIERDDATPPPPLPRGR